MADLDAKGAERRREPRIDARIEVQFSTQNEFAVSYTKNISRGGIFLETAILPDPNATVEIILDLKKIAADLPETAIKLKGKVVRLMTMVEDGKTIHKAGIQFVDTPPQIQVQLDELYARLSSDS